MTTKIGEYDIIEVIADNPSVPDTEIGDSGTVLIEHQGDKKTVAYEIECVLPGGGSKWLGTFRPNKIRLVQKAKYQYAHGKVVNYSESI
jgi:hypothetical protein